MTGTFPSRFVMSFLYEDARPPYLLYELTESFNPETSSPLRLGFGRCPRWKGQRKPTVNLFFRSLTDRRGILAKTSFRVPFLTKRCPSAWPQPSQRCPKQILKHDRSMFLRPRRANSSVTALALPEEPAGACAPPKRNQFLKRNPEKSATYKGNCRQVDAVLHL